MSLNSDIVIVNHNGGQNILACLAAVFGSIPSTCRVILVDNASQDGSAEAIQENFPEVHLISSTVNLGFGAGCNLGARYGKNEFLIFLNPDTLVKEGWLEALLEPFQTNQNIGLTTAKILLMDDPDRINACGNCIHFTGLTFCRGLGAKRTAYSETEEIAAISGAAFAARKETFEELGGFDEDMFLYMEDTDLSWRVRLLGKTCVFLPDSIVLHRYSLRTTPDKIFYLERNRYLMLLKNLRWPTLFLFLPAQILAELMVWGYIFWRHPGSAGRKIKTYQWLISNWRTIMKKRKGTQKLRKVRDRVLLEKTSFSIDFGQINQGLPAMISRLVFNPLFFVLHRVSLALVWW